MASITDSAPREASGRNWLTTALLRGTCAVLLCMFSACSEDPSGEAQGRRDSDAGAGTDGGSQDGGQPDATDSVADAAAHDSSSGAGDCPEGVWTQSERPECPFYCPADIPEGGTPCSDRLHECRYGELEFCVCLEGDLTWECGAAECMWDAANEAWLGLDCGDCPLVSDPRQEDEYGACEPEAPMCTLNQLAYFYCEGGVYRYGMISPP